MNLHKFSWWTSVVFACLALALWPSSVSYAQDDESMEDVQPEEGAPPTQPSEFIPPVGLAEAFQPDFLRRDAQLFIEHFKLDAEQQDIFEALFNDYEVAFQKGAAEARAELSELRPTSQEQERVVRQHHEALTRQLELMVDEIRELQEIETPESQEQQIALRQKAVKIQEQIRLGGAAAVDVDVMRQLMEQFDVVIGKWEAKKSAQFAEFIASARAVLSEAQNALWPAFERLLRRVNQLPQGHLSGEQIDLLAMIKGITLTVEQRGAITELLLQYELALDIALKNRVDFLRSARTRRAEVLAAGDVDGAHSIMNQELEKRIAVRNVNEDYARSIADALGPKAGELVTNAFRKAAYARAFRRTWGERSFDVLLQVPNLASATRADLETLSAEHGRQIAFNRDQIIALMREQEPRQILKGFVAQVERVAGKETPQVDDNPLFAAFTRMRDQELMTVAQGVGLLSDEQKAELPAFVLAAEEDPAARAEVAQVNPPQGLRMTPEQKRALYRQYDVDNDGELSSTERLELNRELERRARVERDAKRENNPPE